MFFNGKSKYSFTDVSWNAKWIINNLNLKNQLIEVGATDYIELEKLAKLINSTAKFDGEIDDQIILLGEPSILSEKSLKESKIYHLNTGGSKFRCKVIFNVCKLYNISIKNAETIALTLENLQHAS